MVKVATAIKSFASQAMQANVPPSEEPVFILTSGQLQDIITQAVEKAIQPLQDEISQLRATVAAQDEVAALREERAHDREELADLRQQIASLTTLQEEDVDRLALDIALDRQRLARLEHPTKAPGKTELSRAEKIEKYLASRPDHRATFETLKGHLGIDKVLLNQAIKTLMDSSPGRYDITRAPGDKRKRTLVMLPK